MSTYLENDLHSVYVDNELPPAYHKTYESLVASDERHAAALRKMQSLRDDFRQDSKTLDVDDAFLEASFARLQTKLRYHKHAVAPQDERPVVHQFTRWGISFAAAAAVFALAITPALRTGDTVKDDAINAIKSSKFTPIAQNDIAVDGNFNQKTLSAIAVNGNSAVRGATMVSTATSIPSVRQKSHRVNLNDSLTSIDVFRPASAHADNGLSIRISISPMHDMQDEETIIPLPNIAITSQQ